MTNRDMSLALRLQADASRFVAGLTQAESGVRRFGRGARQEFDSFKGVLTSVQGQLASLGLTVGAVATIVKSAGLDKELQYLKNTTGGTREEIAGLRKELYDLQRQTGQGTNTLREGVDALVAGGASLAEARATIGPIAEVMATAKTNAADLAKALGVVKEHFKIDLEDIEQARLVLDKMKVAGEQGYAELSNLPALFATVGGSAKAAGMNLDQTLALIETLSLVQPNPERLSTLVESTLRVFTNKDYRDKAEKASGVKFTDENGMNRDPIRVLREMQEKFKRFKTDAQQLKALDLAFGGADKDTIEGQRALLTGTLDKYGPIEKKIGGAAGSTARDIHESINNAAVAAERLRGVLGKAADEFAQPINEAFTNIVNWSLDKKENGGLELDGKDMLAGGALAALGIFGTARYGGKAISGVMNKFGGTAAGVAQGKALEAIAGVTPVFVVNWPASIGGADIPGLPGGKPDAKIPAAKGGWRMAGNVGLAAAPLALMYGVSEWAGDTSNDANRINALAGVSDLIKNILHGVGFNKDADFAARLEKNRAELDGKIEVVVRGEPVAVIASNTNPRVRMDVDSGRTMMMP